MSTIKSSAGEGAGPSTLAVKFGPIPSASRRGEPAPAANNELIDQFGSLPSIDPYRTLIGVDPSYYCLVPETMRDEILGLLCASSPASSDAALEEAAKIAEASDYDHQAIGVFQGVEIARVIRALKSAAPTQTDGWQPIETAPKDGVAVLLFGLRQGQPVFAVDWYRRENDGAGFVGWGKFNMQYWPPTHWRPLPAAPTLSTSDERN